MTHPPANPHGAHLTVDLDAIVHNWRLLASFGKDQGAECGGVVKANAYGTGIEQTGAALAKAGCRIFFVAHVTEGERLRRVAPEAVIYVLNGLPSGGAAAYRAANLRPVLGSIEEIGEWGSHVTRAGLSGEAAIHVDTGLNRLGLDPEDWRELAAKVGNGDYGFMPSLLMTHLASSETLDTPQNAAQACINKVDLPIPGSPPNRITDPRTKPPPVTRSSSAMPEAMRGASSGLPDRPSSAKIRPLPRWPRGTEPPPGRGAVALSSAMVLQPPQASQRPCQRV